MLLTVREVAERLRISLSKVYALLARGELSCYEIGTCKRVSEADLDAFLEQRKAERVKIPKRQGRHF